MKERGEGKGRGVESRGGAGDEMLNFEYPKPDPKRAYLLLKLSNPVPKLSRALARP